MALSRLFVTMIKLVSLQRGSILLANLLLIQSVSAQVEHVSVHKRLFEIGNLPMLKLNIVAPIDDITRLEFVLTQQNNDEKLLVQHLNPFMLLLMGLIPVTDVKAKIIVRSFERGHWHELMQIGLFPENELDNNISQISHPPSASQPAYIAVNPQPSAISVSTKKCLLEYTGNESLWRLGTHYAEIWHTNVYGAMLAIYYTNLSGFNQQKINGLRKDAKLYCPTEQMQLKWVDKDSAKATFKSIE